MKVGSIESIYYKTSSPYEPSPTSRETLDIFRYYNEGLGVQRHSLKLMTNVINSNDTSPYSLKKIKISLRTKHLVRREMMLCAINISIKLTGHVYKPCYIEQSIVALSVENDLFFLGFLNEHFETKHIPYCQPLRCSILHT